MALTEYGDYAGTTVDEYGRRLIASGALLEDGTRVFGVVVTTPGGLADSYVLSALYLDPARAAEYLGTPLAAAIVELVRRAKYLHLPRAVYQPVTTRSARPSGRKTARPVSDAVRRAKPAPRRTVSYLAPADREAHYLHVPRALPVGAGRRVRYF